LGQPLDGLPKAATRRFRASRTPPINPLQRPAIDQVLETGIRAIDAMLTVGRGQRIGIFAGSGVGKSTLLGMIAREAKTDVNVIALIGERGREVREFIDKQLGAAGLARSVVVAAAADQPPLARLQAAYAALAIAEDFRDQGLHVTLTLDSITRFATARREVGLSAGEPPTARGFTPSVFAELPELCERCGTAPSGGSITALMTVLVEGDDPSEPIADTLRAILDGHVMLSRNMAQRGHFPAIDILSSASRVMSDIVSKEERDAAIRLRSTLDLIERNRQLVEIGAYAAGSNPALDRALRKQDRLDAFLRQAEGGVARSDALAMLMALQGEEA
jgi:flagellum-specific ATP synthase